MLRIRSLNQVAHDQATESQVAANDVRVGRDGHVHGSAKRDASVGPGYLVAESRGRWAVDAEVRGWCGTEVQIVRLPACRAPEVLDAVVVRSLLLDCSRERCTK